MATIQKRTISLPGDQAAFIDAKVSAGDYASASEVIRAGIRALKERDEAVGRWLQHQVAQSFDAMRADPARGVSVDDAFASVRARHAERVKDQT
ncbi:plasmid stabilization protein [Rhizobium altiplani]|uniref:Plasmid stabilization protein n=1 Tax=Rhizobium altiplani TaxID=1864509 RepID=A0A120FRF7_9HYPH|nr:type II toxin-antitoxin system ParD family antitoxin [Rhizobium altiplani]KWV60066.1 plasmid stabilization protein [Rhizobium altiplani]